MSWQAAAWVDSLPYDIPLTMTQSVGHLPMRVLFKLANVADAEGKRAFRSKAVMADELGVTARSVQRALNDLQAAQLIRPGNQLFVAHLRADKRPTVYDLNFRYRQEFAQPELPAWDGETEISTPPTSGETEISTGETTADHQGTVYSNENLESFVPNRAQETAEAFGPPSSPLPRWSRDACPGDWQHPENPTHQLGSSGACVRCFERPTNGAAA